MACPPSSAPLSWMRGAGNEQGILAWLRCRRWDWIFALRSHHVWKIDRMTDRADEIAREIVTGATTLAAPGIAILGHDRSALIGAIADALRSYRDETINEAIAKLMECHGRGRPDLAGAKIVAALKSQQDKPT